MRLGSHASQRVPDDGSGPRSRVPFYLRGRGKIYRGLGLFNEGKLTGRGMCEDIYFVHRPQISEACRKLFMDPTIKVPEPRRLRPEDGIWVEPGVMGVDF